MPLDKFEKSKQDLFEEEPDPSLDPFIEEYFLTDELTRDIETYEATTGKIREPRYPSSVWALHTEKLKNKIENKRHLLRRLGAHVHRLDPKVAFLVADTMTTSTAAYGAELTL